ncbi:gas vesicle protein GvpJ [Egicoccus sp. AB-alg2]|uniref:gas vesicle protein GvpJ n=1 Tax=Egicoccus sp. AB-alg2 TaxID=3242693 RepID=UPI00359CBA3E
MSSAQVARRPASGTLAEVIDIILDKGLVIDAYVRVSLVGIELLTIDVRVVVASVDTYLHFAEATNRLDLRGQAEEHDADLQDLVGGMGRQVASSKTSGAIEGGVNKIRDMFSHDEESEEQPAEDES